MEALIVAIGALIGIVTLEAGYQMAKSLVRWAPVIAVGALVGWLAGRHGADSLEALGLSVLACLIARHVMCPARYYHEDGSQGTRA